MNNKAVDIMIYIRPGSDTGLITNTIKQVTRMTGVIAAKTNPRVKNLISIKYNPEQLSGTAIVNGVRRDGYTASLIGM